MDFDQPSTPPATNPNNVSPPMPPAPVSPPTFSMGPSVPPVANPAPVDAPSAPAVPPAPAPMPATPPVESAESAAQETDEVDGQIKQFVDSKPAEEPQHVAPLIEPSPTAPASDLPNNIVGQTIIQPLPDDPAAPKKDINQLYQEEMAKETTPVEPAENTVAETTPNDSNEPTPTTPGNL